MNKYKLISNFRHRFIWTINVLKTNGLKALFQGIIDFIYLKRDIYILIFDLSTSFYSPKNNMEIKIIRNDFDILKRIRSLNPNLPAEFYFDQIDGCKQFYLLVLKNNNELEPAAICWIYDYKEFNKILFLKKYEVEFKHGITLEKYRGRGLFTTLLYYMLEDLKNRGFERIVNIIETHNKASIKIHQNIGFKIIKKWTFKKVFGVTLSKKFSTSQITNMTE